MVIKQYDHFKSKVVSLVTSFKCIQEITINGDILKIPPQLILFTIVISKTINKYCCFINIHRHQFLLIKKDEQFQGYVKLWTKE